MLFAIIGILLLNNGVTNGVVGLALVLLLYGTGYFFASRPQHEALPLAGAKDAPEIHEGLDEILATIRPRVADDIYYRVRSIRDAIVFTLETRRTATRSTRPSTWFARRRRHTCPRRCRPTWACRGSYAERERVDGGRTPHDILLDQLYLMDLKVRQVAEDLVKNGSQRLVRTAVSWPTATRAARSRSRSSRHRPHRRCRRTSSPRPSNRRSRDPSGSACGGHPVATRA